MNFHDLSEEEELNQFYQLGYNIRRINRTKKRDKVNRIERVKKKSVKRRDGKHD
jgi:hypothetical protein